MSLHVSARGEELDEFGNRAKHKNEKQTVKQLQEVAPAFIEMAHRIAWATAATVGYDPTIIPQWTSPTADAFAVLRLEPWRLRVFPGTALAGQGKVLTWKEGDRV